MTITIGPNGFAAVMGTGIVAVAAASLPVHVAGLRGAATVVWAAAAVLLLILLAVSVRHLRPAFDDPVMVQFWGAPPMALMTVGAGTLLLGRDWIGRDAAVAVAVVLWTAGTVLGLVVAVGVPYLMVTRHEIGADAAFGGWLMPVVPPMVSASTGALLVPHVGDQGDLLLACGAMFGISLLAAFVVIVQIWGRLVRDLGAPRMVPTLWIVLGPLGQSVTAVHLITAAAGDDHGAVALVYGVPVMGFALFWLALVVALTVRAVRAGLPFTLAWWSFTFPLGTVVTGLNGLAARTGSPAVGALAVTLYAVLVAAWLVVGVRTVRGLCAPAPSGLSIATQERVPQPA